jgi:succinyl-diaminopimelate desuccinylase
MVLEQHLRSAVTERRDRVVELTQALIRFPTLNPPGEGYLEICEFLRDWLAPSGFESEMIRAEGAPGDSEAYPRWNLISRRQGKSPGQCIHFNSHIDVVEVGHGWTFDPFGGVVAHGRVYGRGACDMKGGLAASIIAVEAFLEVHPDFPGSIEISATADEESGGFGGVAYLAGQGRYSHVDHVIIPEPLNKDRVCLGHRGVWWAELETEGRIAHGSMPFLGDCAVRHMGAVMEEMERSLFPALALRHTNMPVVPEEAKQSSLNINSIHGGEAELEDYTGLPSPNVPDRCRMVIDRRFLIEEPLDAVKAEFHALVQDVAAKRGFDFSLRDIQQVQPVMTEKDAPVAAAVSDAIYRVLDKSPEYVVSPGTYDQKHIDRIGKLKNCIAYGPGILDLAHQPDEYVEIEAMVESAQVMALATGTLLLGEQQ